MMTIYQLIDEFMLYSDPLFIKMREDDEDG